MWRHSDEQIRVTWVKGTNTRAVAGEHKGVGVVDINIRILQPVIDVLSKKALDGLLWALGEKVQQFIRETNLAPTLCAHVGLSFDCPDEDTSTSAIRIWYDPRAEDPDFLLLFSKKAKEFERLGQMSLSALIIKDVLESVLCDQGVDLNA